MQDFDEKVADFLRAEKAAEQRFRWLSGAHPDFLSASSRLVAAGDPIAYGRLILTIHKYRKPIKCSFSVLFGSHRVFALDVFPGHFHHNKSKLESVYGTHWQVWPNMEAEPDSRDFTYIQWLDAFLKKANIQLMYPFNPPTLSGIQLELSYGQDSDKGSD